MTSRMKRLVLTGVILGGLGALAVVGVFWIVLVRGPHMIDQPHLRSFEAAMPLPPEGSVPAGMPYLAVAPEKGATAAVETNQESIQRGAVYYRYYCLACHGEKGDGNGPVGESYMPVPADLRSAEVQSMEDGALIRAMLSGTGHEPVLPQVVPEEHRRYLALYLGSLGQGR